MYVVYLQAIPCLSYSCNPLQFDFALIGGKSRPDKDEELEKQEKSMDVEAEEVSYYFYKFLF